MKRACLFLLLAACGHAQPATVEGVVVHALTGAPIRNAHVRLSNDETKYGAVTDTEGRFSIASLTPGKYVATADRNGYLLTDDTSVSLKANEHPRDLRFQLMPAAVISGRVVDENSVGVQAINVTVQRGGTERSSRTDDEGQFRIAGLRAGKYLLRASPEWNNAPPEIRSDGTAEVIYGPTYYPGVPASALALAVEVKAGGERGGLTIPLARQKVVRISGTVTGEVPKDLTIASVICGTTGSVRLQRDGSFVLWRIPQGQHSLRAEFRGPRDESWRSAPLDLVVGDANLDHLELTVMRPFELTGKVVDWNGKDGKLRLRSISMSDDVAADIGADGAFRLQDMQPDLYRISIANLPENSYVRRVRLGALEMEEGLLDLRRGTSRDSLDIALSTNAARVTGSVTNDKGPVAGALVALFREGHHANELRIVTHSSKDGSYSFGGLAPGKYAIVALAAGEPEEVAQYDEKLETVDVSEGDTLRKDLKIWLR